MKSPLATLALVGLLALAGCHRAEVTDDPAADPATQRAVDQASDVEDRKAETKGMSPDDPMANGTVGDVSTSTSLPPDPNAERPQRPPRRAVIDTGISDVSTPKTDQPQ
jgi:hypothetical protein